MRDIIATPRFERDLKKIPEEMAVAFDRLLPRLQAMPTVTPASAPVTTKPILGGVLLFEKNITFPVMFSK